MRKDILIYGRIDEWNARKFFESLEKVFDEAEDENPQIRIRINTDGGNPEMGWAMCSKIGELIESGIDVDIIVDGSAYSMGAFALCYVPKDKAIGYDVTRYMFHRAAYSEWLEGSDRFSEDLKSNLIATNKMLEKAFRARVDVVKFEQLKGVKVKDLFSIDNRIDVFLSATEAKQIGLISKVIKLTPQAQAQINSEMAEVIMSKDEYKMAAKLIEKKPEVKEEKEIDDTKITNMTIDEIKAKHPEVYAQILEQGNKAGVMSERTRVKAFLSFHEIDAAEVKKAINEGREFTSADTADFTAKALSSENLKKITADNQKPGAAAGGGDQPSDKEKELAKFDAEVNAALGIKQKVTA